MSCDILLLIKRFIRFARFVVHGRLSFAVGDNPFLAAWVAKIRPSYTVPSRFVLSTELLVAEHSRVLQLEKARVRASKRFTFMTDGWEDLLRRSQYASIAQERGGAGILLNIEEMTGKRVDSPQLVGLTKRAMSNMDIDPSFFIAVCSDNPNVMRKYRRDFVAEFKFLLVGFIYLCSREYR